MKPTEEHIQLQPGLTINPDFIPLGAETLKATLMNVAPGGRSKLEDILYRLAGMTLRAQKATKKAAQLAIEVRSLNALLDGQGGIIRRLREANEGLSKHAEEIRKKLEAAAVGIRSELDAARAQNLLLKNEVADLSGKLAAARENAENWENSYRLMVDMNRERENRRRRLARRRDGRNK